MIDRILELAMRQRAFVLLLALGLLGGGLWSALQLPIDAVPDITGVQVQVNTEVPALAAEESERLVTRPIEVELAGMPGVEEMRSITKFGLSQVTLQFIDGTDIYRARQLVAERLQNALEQLPSGISPKLAPISTGLGEILYYNVQFRPDAKHKPTTELEQLIELSDLQEYTIKPMLRTVQGIAEINGIGGFEKQIVIQPDPRALERSNLTFSELAEIIRQNVENAGGGILNRNGQQLTIRALSRVNTPEQIGNLPIKFGGAVKPILVKDIAEVTLGTKFRTGAATLNGHQTVIGTAMMLAGENSREVARRVKDRIQQIQTKLPEHVQIVLQYDRSELIERTIHTVEKNLFEGALLVVAVLLALLGNWRAALIVSAAIPLSFLFAITGMLQGKVSGNLMSLGAVDFGLIIDGAVVIVENIVRQLGEKQHHLGRTLSKEETSQVVLRASKQVGAPMFFGVVIITIVYFPILALTGIEGKMFRPMAITVILALVGALLLALSLMPVLCSFLLRGKISEGDNLLIRITKRIYAPTLLFALKARLLLGIAILGLFVASGWMYVRLGAEFVPTLDEGAITAALYKPVGMSLEESTAREMHIESVLLKEFPEIERIFSRLGTSAIASDPMPPNESDLYIFYKPIDTWPKTPGRPTSKAELLKAMEKTVKNLNPDYDILFAQPIEMRFNEMLEGTKAQLAVKIFGSDFDVLEKLAAQIKDILEKMPGTAQVELETDGRTPQLEIQVQRDALQRFNLQAEEVNKAVSTALAGKSVGIAMEGNRRRDIVVRMPEALRANDEQVKNLPLRVGEHGLVKLQQVVSFRESKTVEPIRRDGGQRRAALMVNLNVRDVEGYVHEAERKIQESVKLPDQYVVEFGGQFKNLQEARIRLAVVVPTALALIFILIFLAFGSLRQAFIVYSGIPLAITGGIVALWCRGMPFSITAAVGFIALSGVAVLNGLVLVTYFNELRTQGRALWDAVVEGATTRLRPVLMTALVASLGFIPMAIAQGAGAEVQRPLATVVIGGIISSTILTLIILPSLYFWLERSSHAEHTASPLPEPTAIP